MPERLFGEKYARGTFVADGRFLATVTQFAPAVRELGLLGGELPLAAGLLRQVAAGEVTGAVALAEGGSWQPPAVRATAAEAVGGWVIDGVKEAVLDGAHADRVLVVARAAGTSPSSSRAARPLSRRS